MNNNWKLYYKEEEDGWSFGEIIDYKNRITFRSGKILTHGILYDIPDLEALEKQLDDESYTLKRKWEFNPKKKDYRQLQQELNSAIDTHPNSQQFNALSLITDSDLMTIDFAVNDFPDLAKTDDEKIWIVDEWDGWNSSSNTWQLDISYRWILTHGFYSPVNDLLHSKRLRNTLIDVLNCYKSNKEILLIYIGGDDCGHKWSAKCMTKEIRQRMLNWI